MQILVIKPSSLGDIICSLPVAQSIRDQMPAAEISWIVKTCFREIVRRCPTVNGDIIEFDRGSGLPGVVSLWKTLRSLQQRRFDVVLDFQGLLRTGLMTRTVDSPRRIGSPDAREGSWLAYDHVVSLPPSGRDAHATERLLQFLPAIGLEPALRSPVVIQGDASYDPDNRLAGSTPIVMIPNSRGAQKEWPYFPELTEALLNARPDAFVVWDSPVPWEDPSTRHADRFVNLTTKTSLMQMVELLRRARLVIANDSGPLHIAAALGRPTLGLFGPTSSIRFGPYPLSERRNNVVISPDGQMTGLCVDHVFATVLRILESESESESAAAA